MKLLEGKVKTVFETDEEDKVLIKYEDRVTAFNGEHIEYPRDKGATCCMISALLFERLESVGIKTHYLSVPTLNTMLCRKVKIVPVEVICRNRAAGSIIEHTEGLEEGQLFDPPIIDGTRLFSRQGGDLIIHSEEQWEHDGGGKDTAYDGKVAGTGS